MPFHSIKNETYGSYQWLMREVGRSVGREKNLSPDPSIWDHSDRLWVDSIVQSGYQQFCTPPPLTDMRSDDEDSEARKDDRRRQPHTWSFLHRMETIEVNQGDSTAQLPQDFVGVTGEFVIETGKGRLPVVPEAQLRALIAKDPNEDTPRYASIRSKMGEEGQRYDLILYPTPKDDLTLSFRYAVNPGDLSDDNQFPYGGRQHAEAVLASCLAVAEDREKGVQGPAHAKFMERLSASIHLDKQSEASEEATWTLTDETDGNTLLSLAGLHMGFGQNPDAWTQVQRREVLQIVTEGVARFHQAAPQGQRTSTHEWSFLTPIHTINLESSKSAYDLPDDFGGFAGLGGSPLTYAAGDNVIYPSIEIVGEHHIRRLLQQTVQATGRPVKAGHGQKENRDGYEIKFWPVPDDSYVLNCRYRANPSQDMTTIPGSDAHFLTILEAIRAAADVYQKRRNRPHEAIFQERLAASIAYDQQLAAPAKMGYNRDGTNSPTGDPYDDRHRAGWGQGAVTYNGNLYT